MIPRDSLRTFALAAVLAAGTSFGVLAQETDTEEPVAPIEDELSLGEDANVPQPYIKEEIGDWALRCLQSPEGEERCQIYQLLNDANDTPIAEFTLFRLPEGGRALAGATIVVPLETALQNQLTITVDSGQARRYPFAFCNPIGCYARIGLTEQDVNAFKRGNAATLQITPFGSNEQVQVSLSLTGFTAAFDKASVIAQ